MNGLQMQTMHQSYTWLLEKSNSEIPLTQFIKNFIKWVNHFIMLTTNTMVDVFVYIIYLILLLFNSDCTSFILARHSLENVLRTSLAMTFTLSSPACWLLASFGTEHVETDVWVLKLKVIFLHLHRNDITEFWFR